MSRVESAFLRLKELAAGAVGDGVTREIEENLGRLQTGQLYLVVVGLFKRGKSSLINALLGKAVAPVGVTPVTAMITLFDYGERPEATVYFENGDSILVRPEAIGSYVSEKENPGNRKGVQYVRIKEDSELLKGVSLVDTPGLDSVYEHNSETTLGFVPQIDAALYVLSADIPISKADDVFLRKLTSHVPKILFVLNKADLLDDQELSEVLAHNAEALSNLLRIPVRAEDIHVVSGRYPKALSSRLGPLREEIRRLVGREKTTLLERSAAKRFDWLRERSLLQLRLQLESLNMPLGELEDRKERLDRSAKVLFQQREEFDSIIAAKMRLMQEGIATSVNAFNRELRQSLEGKFHEATLANGFPEKEGDVRVLKRELDQWLLERFESLKEEQEETVKARFRDMLQQYSSRSQGFLRELTEQMQMLTGTDFDSVLGAFDLDAYTSFYLSLDSGEDLFTLGNSILGQLLGPRYRRRKTERMLRAHCRNVLVRNASSIIYDLQYRIQESFRKFARNLNVQVDGVLEELKRVIGDTLRLKRDRSGEVGSRLTAIRETIDEIVAINCSP